MSEPRPPCAHSLFKPRFESPTVSPAESSEWDFPVGFAKLPLGSRSLPSGKSRTSEWEVARRRVGSREAPSGKSSGREWRFEIENCKFPIEHYQLAADSSHDSPRTGCSPFPRPRRWALALAKLGGRSSKQDTIHEPLSRRRPQPGRAAGSPERGECNNFFRRLRKTASRRRSVSAVAHLVKAPR